MRPIVLSLGLLALAGCGQAASNASLCEPPRRTGTLPAEVEESSGVAASRAHPGILWTHNDSGGEAVIFALDTAGAVVGRVRITGARNRDWEDIALGPCGARDCLYLADTGDNRQRRPTAAIYRIPEPAPGDTASAPAEPFLVRYPEGPRDVEALYLLPGEQLYLVSKGREHPVALYRYPGPPRAGEPVELERVQQLGDGPAPLPYQVTGAAATPDGRWVAVRTYTAVQLHRVLEDGRLSAPGRTVDVQVIAEPQGEAVELLADGTVLLTSEAGPAGVPGTVARMECRLR